MSIKSCSRLLKEELAYLRKLEIARVIKSRYRANIRFKDNEIEVYGNNFKKASEFITRVLKEDQVDLSAYALPVSVKDWLSYTIEQQHSTTFDKTNFIIRSRLGNDLRNSVAFFKKAHAWSRVQHIDVLQDCEHIAQPFYPSYDPSDTLLDSSSYSTLVKSLLIPPDYEAFRLIPRTASKELMVSSFSNRQYMIHQNELFKLYVVGPLKHYLHYQMGVFDWKVDSGYSVHIRKNPLKSSFSLDTIHISNPSKLRNISDMTLFQPIEEITDNLIEKGEQAIKAYIYLSGIDRDYRVTVYEGKTPQSTELHSFLTRLK